MEQACFARWSRPPGHQPALAVAGEVDLGALRRAGWRLSGRLPLTRFDDPRDAPSYVDLDELLADERVDGVVLDGSEPALLPSMREAGLLLLLTGPAPLDLAALRAASLLADARDVAVALRERWAPWAQVVRAALPLAGGPPRQVTVRGWPRGAAAAAELVDLVQDWCGEVVLATSAPAALPVAALPSGERVAWSLLTETGATVLVATGDRGAAGPLVRLSCPAARLEAGPAGARWTGGDELVLPPAVDALTASAADLRRAMDPENARARTWPWPADLGDLLRAARVVAALEESARTGAPVPT